MGEYIVIFLFFFCCSYLPIILWKLIAGSEFETIPYKTKINNIFFFILEKKNPN